MPSVNYSTLSLNNREQIFLKSVLIIHNGRSDYSWSENNSEFEVLIVGRDADQPITIEPQVKAILSFNPNIERQHRHIYPLASPVKATEMIERFKQIEGILQEGTTLQSVVDQVDNPPAMPMVDLKTSKKFRLLRWPRAELLEQNRVFFILAAILGKGAMSLDELVAVSGKPKELCDGFLNVLVNSGDVESIDIAILTEPQVAKKPAVQKSLLDKIRSRLGIFQK